ncbi:MAG: Rab family GTPase [Lysobacterales bacterium]
MQHAVKICVLGEAAVGKSEFISSFSGRETETSRRIRSGVQVETGSVETANGVSELVVWDILCADGGFVMETPYMVGVRGCIVVCDRTRRPTVTASRALISRLEDTYPGVVCLLAMNKSDLSDRAEITAEDIEKLRASGLRVVETSSQTGKNVSRCFEEIVAMVHDNG